ncbi:hypothetical protein DPEC_G00339970, partial [Dallia pectoralis]
MSGRRFSSSMSCRPTEIMQQIGGAQGLAAAVGLAPTPGCRSLLAYHCPYLSSSFPAVSCQSMFGVNTLSRLPMSCLVSCFSIIV